MWGEGEHHDGVDIYTVETKYSCKCMCVCVAEAHHMHSLHRREWNALARKRLYAEQ